MLHYIFDKPISIKDYTCNVCGKKGRIIDPRVNIFVKVTNKCNANCMFCSNGGCGKDIVKFNVSKLNDIISELEKNYITVNKINITGGEPSCVPTIVHSLLETVPNHIHIHLNTNGLTKESQKMIRIEDRIDSISMSLHHYDIDKLSDIYRCKVSLSDNCFDGVDMSKVNASCNLIKGYIDNEKEVEKMLDFSDKLGIRRIGFVGLMTVNDFCKDNYIDYSNIDFESIDGVVKTKWCNRGKDCRCVNYMRDKLEIYIREYCNPLYFESSLLYDGEYLRQGFHDDNIIY